MNVFLRHDASEARGSSALQVNRESATGTWIRRHQSCGRVRAGKKGTGPDRPAPGSNLVQVEMVVQFADGTGDAEVFRMFDGGEGAVEVFAERVLQEGRGARRFNGRAPVGGP